MVYTIVANFGVLRMKSSNHSSSCFIAFSETSRPSKHDAEIRNRSEFEDLSKTAIVASRTVCFVFSRPSLTPTFLLNYQPQAHEISFAACLHQFVGPIFSDFDSVPPESCFYLEKNLKLSKFSTFLRYYQPKANEILFAASLHQSLGPIFFIFPNFDLVHSENYFFLVKIL